MINSAMYIHSQLDTDKAECDVAIADSLLYQLNTNGFPTTLAYIDGSLSLHVGRKENYAIIFPRDIHEALNVIRGIYLTTKES